MIKAKKLKKELGDKYSFKRFLTEREVKNLQKQEMSQSEPLTVSSLTVGCVKIEASIYPQKGKLLLGYDVFVKDDPESLEWICYDSPNDPVSFREEDMLLILDRVVQKNGLSYTECCFERVKGRLVKVDKMKTGGNAL